MLSIVGSTNRYSFLGNATQCLDRSNPGWTMVVLADLALEVAGVLAALHL